MNESIEDLIEKVKDRLNESDLKRVQKAYQICFEAHQNQFRKSGRPYYTHPLSVAYIITEISCDASLICASLLHDVLEDTQITDQELEKIFGNDIFKLVKGVTKLGKIYFGSDQEAQVENYRRLFLATAEDIRVVIVKLCDRFHNMKTLQHLSPAKQLRISKETLDIFVPIANRLGMGHIKWEMEDLAFSFINQGAYQHIKSLISNKREDREEHVQFLINYVSPLLSEKNIQAKISGRPKHFYSIYRKMVDKNLNLESVHDITGIRIITPDVACCYEVLGIIHSKLKPISNRIKDYIAMPKANMYQSLHTTVIGPKGFPVEFQIRTQEMDDVAEHGIAAHWRYKKRASNKNFKANFNWLDQLIQTDSKDPSHYLNTIKLDLYEEEVFVFSPKGDIHALQKGATPLDFAYKIHSDVGNRCRGATVNGMMVPLHYELKNGDQLEILTQRNIQPRLGWLEIVKTREARNKIKAWFRKQKESENLEKGQEIIRNALMQAGIPEQDPKAQNLLKEYCEKMRYKSMDALYLALSYGDISSQSFIQFIQRKNQQSVKNPVLQKTAKHHSNIAVLGHSDLKFNIAKCCHPFPGDHILGFITVGQGITIHRASCQNLAHKKEKYPHRIVEAEWLNQESEANYQTTIFIEAYERAHITNEIIAKILEANYQLMEASSKSQKGGQLLMRIRVLSTSKKPIANLLNTLRKIEDVYAVYRPE